MRWKGNHWHRSRWGRVGREDGARCWCREIRVSENDTVGERVLGKIKFLYIHCIAHDASSNRKQMEMCAATIRMEVKTVSRRVPSFRCLQSVAVILGFYPKPLWNLPKSPSISIWLVLRYNILFYVMLFFLLLIVGKKL